jgi:DNA-binding MarR family transcriptional regulator
VSELLAMDRTTLTASLKPLARRGLIEVFADENDKRSRRMKLTPAGSALLAKAVPVWAKTEAEIEALLGRSSPDRLRADLVALS